jgi:hypothetical protein
MATTTLTVQEFTAILNLTAKAPSTIGDAHAFSPILNKAIEIVNQGHPIGAIVPVVDPQADVVA